MTDRWFVVPGADDRLDPEAETWTVSLNPDKPGWETDMGCPGYGLTKALAEELAEAANFSAARRERRGPGSQKT